MDANEARYMIRHTVAEFIRYCSNTITLTDITEAGAQGIVHVYTELAKLEAIEDDEDSRLIQRSKMAKSELARGFPLLYAHSLMGAWGALEVAMDDLCVGWLAETDGAALASAKLKVPIGELLSLSDVDKWRWLLEQIKRDQSSLLKPGVGQFEVLLDAVGVGGSVDDDLRKALFLVKQYRNIIAHRGGRVDAKFLRDCPTLNLALGDTIRVTHSHFMAAVSTMLIYSESVLHRTVRARGGSREDKLPEWISSTRELVDTLEKVAKIEDESIDQDEKTSHS